MAIANRQHRTNPNIWPGFVDAMATLLIILIFLLMVSTLAHFFLNELLAGRNEAMNRLNRQIAELSEMLSLERETNVGLRSDLGLLSAQLQNSITERDRLSLQLGEVTSERDRLSSRLGEVTLDRERLAIRLSELLPERDALRTQAADLTSERDKLRADLVDAFKSVDVDKEKITVQLAQLESLRRDIAALRSVRDELESRVTRMAATLRQSAASLKQSEATLKQSEATLKQREASLRQSEAALTAARDRTKELEARLSTERERTALAQRGIEEGEVRLTVLLDRAGKTADELSRERGLTKGAMARVDLLNRQLAALRQQLARIVTALDAAEAKAKVQRIQIASLGNRLNMALATKVAELARYRSEFFGKLREVLGNRQGIRIVGDRFVFQSEVLFASGAATLAQGGRAEIKKLAKTLREIAARIPKNIDWVLRVDGHTDRVPIKTPQYPSNWELSTGRAISVVKYLVELGLPPGRLAATGFGEHRPIDNGDDEIAYRRNRRIEFKLTQP